MIYLAEYVTSGDKLWGVYDQESGGAFAVAWTEGVGVVTDRRLPAAMVAEYDLWREGYRHGAFEIWTDYDCIGGALWVVGGKSVGREPEPMCFVVITPEEEYHWYHHEPPVSEAVQEGARRAIAKSKERLKRGVSSSRAFPRNLRRRRK